MRVLQQALGEDELETTRRGASRVDVALAFFIVTLGDLLEEIPYVVPFNHTYILNGVPSYLRIPHV